MNAMKRAARAILRDDLKAMRRKHAEELASVNRDVERALEQHRQAAAALAPTRAALDKATMTISAVTRWLDRHGSPHDNVQKAILQYLREGPDGARANTHGVNAFARWGLPQP